VTARVERNTLLTQLARFCESHPIDEKILLAPSLAAGVQILDALARSGAAHVNLRPSTVHTLALEVSGPILASEGRRLLSRAQLLALVEEACDEVLIESSYFGSLRTRPGLHRALQQTLEEIHRAGLSADQLPAAAFEDRRKAEELRAIGRAYRAALARHGFADPAEIVGLATALLTREGGRRSAETAWVLRPDGLEPTPREEEFLRLLAGSRAVPLPTDRPADFTPSAETVAIAAASGEENEIRAVLRRLLDDEIPLDEVEIVTTDDATYRPLLHELSSEYGLPCTFLEGVAVTFSRPGQGILDYLEWVSTGHPAAVLHRLIADGRADFRGVHARGRDVGPVRAARALRQARIFSGAGRYARRLDALVERLSAASEEDDDEQGTASRLATAETLRAFVARLFAAQAPADGRAGVSLPAIARAARLVVAELLAVHSELDGMASKALQNLFEEFSLLPDRRLPVREAASRLREAVEGLSVGSSTPSPGHIHVARFAEGGWSGRPYLFVLGLDESRFPGPLKQDPVLLDHERARLNRALPSAHLGLPGEQGAEDSRRQLRALLARSRAKVVLSFSNRNLLEDAEQFPSSFLLDVFRQQTGRPEASYENLLEVLPAPSGFIPAGAPLDESEWWLERLGRFQRHHPALLDEVERAYPWLGDGAIAEAEREGPRFTPWDGRISASPAELDPRQTRVPLSSSRIELLAKSPRAYFFRYVLSLKPPERERPSDRWLDPMEFGKLLHEVFYAFMVHLRSAGETPETSRHAALLRDIANRVAARWLERIPPPSEPAFLSQRDELLAACTIFLEAEERDGIGVTPRFFEVPFGLARGNPDEPLASPDPVEIRLGASTFLLQGQIDRIDETGPGAWAVWDYKSGSERVFKDERPLWGGRQVQHALYARVAETLLSRAGFEVRAVTSGYFFPTLKGAARRVLPKVDPRDVDATLTDLFDLVGSGAFPHGRDKGACRFCDFAVICGGADLAVKRAERKVSEDDDTDDLLRPLLSLKERDV
jgi:ATP-dependent helicase/nuclease subunit B